MGSVPTKEELEKSQVVAVNKFNQIVDNPDELNITDFYEMKPFVDLVERASSSSIGSGGFGKIYLVDNNPDIIIKVMEPCSENNNYHQCLMMDKSDPQLYRTPNDDKEAILLPNYLSDGIIGGIMSRLVEGGYCPFFGKMYATTVDKNKKAAYIVMERLDQVEFNDGNDIVYFLFCIAFTLWTTQRHYGFTHFDLHMGNILKKDTDAKAISLTLPSGDIVCIKTKGWIPKIIDFGFSRMETPDVRIFPRINTVSPGTFNPVYDIMMLWACLFSEDGACSKNANKWSQNVKDLDYRFEEELISVILSQEYTRSQFTELYEKWYIKSSGSKLYRPNLNSIRLNKVGSMGEIVMFLYKKLNKYGMTINRTQSSMILSNDKIVVSPLPKLFDVSYKVRKAVFGQPKLNYSLGSPPPNSVINPVMPGIVVESSITSPAYYVSRYNYTAPAGLLESDCKLSPQYIHVAYINTNKLDSTNIVMDCCKIDPATYIENRIGFVVNGGFFNMHKDWKPIGTYKDDNLSSDIPTPEKYSKYFKLLYIKDNKIRISSVNDPPQDANYWLTSGPTLVDNGQIVFTTQDLEWVEENVNMMRCRLTTSVEKQKGMRRSRFLPPIRVGQTIHNENGDCEEQIVDLNQKTYNCDTIAPGELTHASNPVPRTAIIWRTTEAQSDGKGEIAFVMVEGRLERGAGADLVYMAKLCQSLGAYRALSLDGGRSSQFVWRTKYNPEHIYRANSTSAGGYMVGNIIAFIKK